MRSEEIQARAAAVRRVKEQAYREGRLALSIAELTAVLGDELGVSQEARRREAHGRRRRLGLAPRRPSE